MRTGTRGVAGRVPAFGAVALAFGMMSASTPSHSAGGWHSPKVLLVGTFHGKAGRYRTISTRAASKALFKTA